MLRLLTACLKSLMPSHGLFNWIYIRKEVGIEDKRQSGTRWSTQPQVGSIKKSRDRG
jgi:hypothetical protein